MIETPGSSVSARLGRIARSTILSGTVAASLLGLEVTAVQAATGLDAPMLVTQVPTAANTPPADWDATGLIRSDWFAGARIVVVTPDGAVRSLSEGFDSACDPSVSFDGKHVLFAGKKERAQPWRIWEVDTDGQHLHPVSPETQNARSPVYATTLFTLDTPMPWFTVVYVVSENNLNEIGRSSAASLFNLKLDGTELRRLTFNPNGNLDPFQMWDGRLIYAAARYPNHPAGRKAHVGLYAIHVEGADMELYGGELGGPIQQMPCATPGGSVVFIESKQASWNGAGQLATVEERRPHVTYQRLTDDAAYEFIYPSPLSDNSVLVARRATGGQANWGIFSFDVSLRRPSAVFDTPEFHEVQAVVIKPRAQPDGHSTVVDTKLSTGTFYGLNCYDADARMAPHLAKGTVKRVRFIEGMPQSASTAAKSPSAGGPFVPRRLVGEAPVEADGSFNVEVPADTPMLLQTLDERGMALANCGWIWVKPKESRGCIGCHEDPERTPENEYVLALRRPSNHLTLPPEQRRTLGFRADIAPVLQKSCATSECHGGNENPLKLPLSTAAPTENDLQAAYQALMAALPNNSVTSVSELPSGKYLDAGCARTSRLVWHLTGTNTSRAWDHKETTTAIPSGKISQMPPAQKGKPLIDEELRTIIQWIDLGAPYDALRSVPSSTAKTDPKP
jgi:hypothetical protein